MMDDHFDSLAESELAVSPPPELTEPFTTATAATTTTAISKATPSASTITRPKSPPLAFERTPNDSLAPLISPPSASELKSASLSSPSIEIMGGLGSPPGNEARLQNVIHRQSIAIDRIHDAFDAERDAWRGERDGLYQRIAALEQLLKTRDHHSPAKSPSVSPSLTSPPLKTNGNTQRLPSIAEIDGTTPLSHRRDGAPRSIDLPRSRSKSIDKNVGFVMNNGHLRGEENRLSPSSHKRTLSPKVLNGKDLGERIALRTTRVPTPPPQKMTLNGVEDTPTRHNTHLNAFLTRSHDDDDPALKGPLNLPELPNKPDEVNFTLDALSKRLEVVASSPDENPPTIFKVPTPGVASPVDDLPAYCGLTQTRSADRVHSDTGSTGKSPSAISPDSAPTSQQQLQERKNLQDLNHGGIRLKKKPSINFGQPLGQLGGFAHRRLS